MISIHLRRHEIMLLPDSARVIIRPFIPANTNRVVAILGRVLELSEEEVMLELEMLHREFESRHYDIEALMMTHYALVKPQIFTQRPLSRPRELLIGAVFSGEYALESAALFNPSIIPHPDQSGVEEGGLRFIMSLRATGEGHISSIEFRSGVIAANGQISLDPVSRFVTMPEVLPNPTYRKKSFILKFHEMGFDNEFVNAVMAPLGKEFTRQDLNKSVGTVRHENKPGTHELTRTLDCVQWLADSNYELRFSSKLGVSERIIFPVSPNESNGIEDARFVRFTDAAGSVMYYATYTAYNGRA
ncbi:MAG: glycosidase, partial [Verrucomicrobiales bacterium VVV1]